MSLPFTVDFPLLLALALALHGLRRRSLSPSGALAAFAVGYAMLAVPLRTFGITLIVFYLVGSRATKAGHALKKSLEEGHGDVEGGYRSASQVLCNSLSAALAAVLWSALYAPQTWPARVLDVLNADANVSASLGLVGFGVKMPYSGQEWCPVTPPPAAAWSRTLIYVALGHFACCLGDTLASELGILSRTPPILITTLKTVPPGTNGGLSLLGTLSSLAGGLVVGLTTALALVWQSPACASQWPRVLLPLLAWGTFAGGFGSLVDSLLGATVQRTRFLNTSKRILTDEASTPPPGADVKVISGFDVLTNNQVNLLSSIVTALVLGTIA